MGASWFSPSLRRLMSYGLLSLPVCDSIDLSARAVLLPARVSDARFSLRRSHCLTQMQGELRTGSVDECCSLSLSASLPLPPSFSLLRCQHCATELTLLSPQPIFQATEPHATLASLFCLSIDFSVLVFLSIDP